MYTFAETESLQFQEKGGEGEERMGKGGGSQGRNRTCFSYPKRRDCRGCGLICEAAIPDLAGQTSSSM